MSLFLKIITITLSIFLASCKTTSPPLYQVQVDKISASTSDNELNELFLSSKPKYEFGQSLNEKNYNVRIYDLVVGMDVQFIPVCLPTTGCMQVMVDVPVTAMYAIIQDMPELNLVAWGKFEELSKDSNQDVNALMVHVKNKLAELSKEKKE